MASKVSSSVEAHPSQALINAIHHADLGRLHEAIKSICKESEVANALFEEKLLVTLAPRKDTGNGDEQGQGKKRQRSRYAVCENCQQEFDVTDNDFDKCHYHDGELEVVEEMWPGNEEEDWGPIDTDANKTGFPEGFKWDCCRERADDSGCRSGRHKEDKYRLPNQTEKRYKWDR